MELHIESVEKDHVVLLEHLLAPCVEQRLAVLQAGRGRGGTGVTVTPVTMGAATIDTVANDGEDIIYLTLGRNTLFEVPLGGNRYTAFLGAGELVVLVDAVVAGRFEETVWTEGSDIVKSLGRVTIWTPKGEQLLQMSHSELGARTRLRRSAEHVYRYAPYGCRLALQDVWPHR